MTRGKFQYRCVECGYISIKWLGRCPSCHSWESFLEESLKRPGTAKADSQASELIPITKKLRQSDERLKTGIEEFDQVLGGGLVKGASILLAGPPGIGKSTLLLQVAKEVSKGGNVIYASAEESFEQVALRASRLNTLSENILLSADNDLSSVIVSASKISPLLLVVDSVQAFQLPYIPSSPGSLVQVRESAQSLVAFTKSSGVPAIMVGHVTKEGQVAGPKVLEHMVDTVIYFEGDSSNLFRIIRTTKNRFGATDEIGVFEMGESGLSPVKNPSAAFLKDGLSTNGVVFPALEGTRIILSEVQSLVKDSIYAHPRQVAFGVDSTKLSLLLAVLEKRANVSYAGCDVYLSTSAGLKIKEPGIDLAAAISLYNGLKEKDTSVLVGAFGELGLDGLVRQVFRAEPRIKELIRMGIERIIIPPYDKMKIIGKKGTEIIQVRTLREALEAAN